MTDDDEHLAVEIAQFVPPSTVARRCLECESVVRVKR